MMQTRNLGIVMNQGADFNLIIGIQGVSGPIDITGYAFKGQMRQNTDSTSPVIAEFVFTLLDQTSNTGQVQWSLSSATIDTIITSEANSLEAQRLNTPFLFDIKMKDSIGTISRIIQGTIEVSPQVTQEGF